MKQSHWIRVCSRRHAFICTATILLTVLSIQSVSNAAIGQKRKPLSLSAVTIIGPQSQTFAPELLAQSRGYFTKLGLTVTFSNNSNPVPTSVAQLLSGSGQFLQAGTSGQMVASQAGAPLRAVAMTMQGASEQIAISSSVADSLHIPKNSATETQEKLQMAALKGSHLVIGTGNTSDAFAYMYDTLRNQGLTVGFNAPNDDVNLSLIGNIGNEIAAFDSGKLPAFSATLPYTAVPNVTVIKFQKIPMVAEAAFNVVGTTTTMITQHPDTVQAVVTAITEAQSYIVSHRTQAERIVGPQLAQYGYTDPAQQALLFNQGYVPFAALSYPSKAAFNATVQLVNAAQPTVITERWDQFTYAKFAVNALKQLHLKFINR